MNRLSQVDVDWAWSPFEPSDRRPWNRRLAAHLYRRAGFAANSRQLDEAVKLEPAEAVKKLVAENVEPDQFRASADALARTILAGGDPERLSAAWVYRLLYTPNQLLEKTTLFWHGHFATSAAKVEDANMMWAQNKLLRTHALGHFTPLVQAIARDPAMLIYLDSATNRKAHPNENFGRELMELFCLGEGNYSEADVQQLARCFTGWEIKNDRFRKNRYQQDGGEKQLLGQTGNFDGEDGVRIVLEQPAMPKFLVRKLIRYFVCDEPAAPDDLVEPLADQFRGGDLQVAPVIERVLGSNLFFSDDSIGRKIRSPVELAIGLLRALDGTTNTISLAEGLRRIGQGLFYPPNVKGWDGGRAWINSSTLLGRANLVQKILTDKTTRFGETNLEEYFASLNVGADAELVQWLDETLLALPLTPHSRERLSDQLRAGSGSQENRIRETIHTLATIPEFQLA